MWGTHQDSRMELVNFNKKAVILGIKAIKPDAREQVSPYNFNGKSWYKLTQVYTSESSGKCDK